MAATASSQEASSANYIDCELRLWWGSPRARTFAASIKLDRGTLRAVRNLSLEAQSIGKIRQLGAAELQIMPHHPSYFGGADLAIHAPSSSYLTVEIEDPDSKQTTEHTLALEELLQQNWTEDLDARGGKVAIERQIYDRLRWVSAEESPIFTPGDTWAAEIQGVRTGLPAGQYHLRVQITGQHIRPNQVLERLVNVDDQGDFTASVPVSVRLPDDEGSYQLEIAVAQRRLLDSLLTSTWDLVRRVEFVCIDPRGASEQISEFVPLARMDAWEASQPGMLSWLAPISNSLGAIPKTAPLAMPERLGQFKPLARSLSTPLAHGKLGRREYEPGLTSRNSDGDQPLELQCLTLEAGAWLAIPIHGLSPDVPHLLTLRVPTDEPCQLTVSVKQTDSRGELVPIGQNHSLYISQRQCSFDDQLQHFEILFWPGSSDNFLMLTNSHERWRASLLDIQLSQAKLEPAARMEASSRQDASAASESESEEVVQETQRLSGIYLDKPLLADLFSCTRQREPQSRRPLESWSVWQAALRRLEQYLQWTQSNLVVLKIVDEGGAIFPSRVLEPTPRYDTGVFWSDGRSPEIKDAVALWLRYAERSGIKTVLAVDLDSPLPGLSSVLARDSSVLQQRPDGKSVSENFSPIRYNPLHSAFQAEVKNVVREILSRYGSSPALAGIQLQLDHDSQLVFGGDRWGYNDELLADFQQDMRGNLPSVEQAPREMTRTLRLAYLQWRARKLGIFLEELADLIASSGHDRKLYVHSARLWDRPPKATDFLQPDSVLRNPSEYLIACGIDPVRLQDADNLVWLEGQHLLSRTALTAEDWIRQVAQHRGLTSAARQPTTASLISLQPTPFRPAQFNKFAEALTESTQAPPSMFALDMLPRTLAGKDLLGQLVTGDRQFIASGAWLPVTSQTSALRKLQATLVEFPGELMQDLPLEPEGSNLRVRVGRQGERTYLQIVNHARWEEDIALIVQHKAPEPKVHFLGRREVNLERSSSSSASSKEFTTWQLTIPAHDLLGLAIEDPECEIVDVVHSPRRGILNEISAELSEFEAIIAQAADPTLQTSLARVFGQFEQWSADGQPVGWNVSSLPGVSITRSRELPHSGQFNLRIDNNHRGQTSAWIQSLPLPVPDTGRLALQAWVRSPSTGGSGTVRLSVSGHRQSGDKFERAADFVVGADSRTIANDWGTQPITLHVADIPDDIDQLSVSIELIGRGCVWVDDVEALQSWLTPDEKLYLQGTLFVAKQKLAENNPYPAEKLLDSYWGHYLSNFQASLIPTDDLGEQLDTSNEPASRRAHRWSSSPNLFQRLRQSLREPWRR